MAGVHLHGDSTKDYRLSITPSLGPGERVGGDRHGYRELRLPGTACRGSSIGLPALADAHGPSGTPADRRNDGVCSSIGITFTPRNDEPRHHPGADAGNGEREDARGGVAEGERLALQPVVVSRPAPRRAPPTSRSATSVKAERGGDGEPVPPALPRPPRLIRLGQRAPWVALDAPEASSR